ncbi:MAG TPA: carbon storage regulator [Pirellulales bacterium]|jgi:carbon storage regulator|nr:carbon storage regulator [Pirellulales bacterium]
MLALTRKVDQRIQIGRDIFITILHVRGKQVRVGVEAPRQVRVKRAELPDEDEQIDGSLTVAGLFAKAAVEAAVEAAHPKKSATAKRRTVRRAGAANPGERAFSSARQPLAEKLHARRALRESPVAVA